MGKNHRHKKRLKSEKSKTQLKTATKFLPKGQNVTNTEFKIKPIVILSQLKASTPNDGQRNLDLKEIFSRMKHYNENMKIKACEDMDYVLKNYKTKVSGGNMPLVIQNLADFIQTKLPRARKAGLNVINTFLRNFPPAQISPYFHYFSVNLRCAMTHIDRNIQEDSILFLDSFLANVPTLTAKHSNQILPDFLMLISKLRTDAEFKRTVTVNLKSKFTSVGWRIIVFSRLYVFLEAILSARILNEIKMDESINCVTYTPASFNQRGVFKSWNALFNPKMYVIDVQTQEKENENIMNKQFSVLIPLLLETWLEGSPVKLPSKEITYLSEETAMLLNCVVKVLHLLWSYLDEEGNRIQTTEGERLIKNLVQNIPYCLINRPKQQDKSNKFLSMFVNYDVKCIQENLLISYLYLVFYCDNPSRVKQNEINNIVTFVNGCLLRDYKDSNIDVTYLLMILKLIIIDKAKLWSRNHVPVHHILENTISLYERGNVNSTTKLVLLKLLSTVNFEPLLDNLYYEAWLESLPKLLLEKSISEDLINVMYDMTRKNKVSFNKGYLNELPLIIGHLSDLQVTDSADPEKAKLKIIDMLFYLPPSSKPLKLLKTILDRNSPYWPEIDHIFNLRREFHRD